MDNVLLFADLRLFKSKYTFKKKDTDKYFDKILRESVIRYINEVKNAGNESLHVLFSWSEVFNYLSMLFVIASIVSLTLLKVDGILLTTILLSSSILFKLVNKLLLHRHDRRNFGLAMSIEILEMGKESLEKERAKLIRELDKKEE